MDHSTPPIGPTPENGRKVGGVPPPQPSSPTTPASEVIPQSVLNSPFAKMFERLGIVPTGKQIMEMMNNLLKQELVEIKKSDESWKKSMRKLKEVAEGNE